MLTIAPFQVDPLAAPYAVDPLRMFPLAVNPTGPIAAPPTASPPVLVPQAAPDPERDAAAWFMQEAAGGVIRRLHEFLQANIKQFAALSDAIPLVQRAAELYEAGDYTRASAQAYQAYRSIGLVRARFPDVPNP